MGNRLLGGSHEIRFCNRGYEAPRRIVVGAASAEIINTLLVDARPLLRTLMTSGGHPSERLGHLRGLITKGRDFHGATGVE